MKSQATEWEKICANYISDKSLVSRTQNRIVKRDEKNPVRKQTKDRKRHFT